MARTRSDELLSGEWACLGILVHGRALGDDVSLCLAPGGAVGRAWTLSRPLTYRALDQLTQRGLIEPIGDERGLAGGNRTIPAPTAHGRARLRTRSRHPVEHLRDRSGPGSPRSRRHWPDPGVGPGNLEVGWELAQNHGGRLPCPQGSR